MQRTVLLRRYTQGLIDTLKDEHEYANILKNLIEFTAFNVENREFAETMSSPFLPASKKKEVAAAVLDHTDFEDKSKRFLLLVIENDRLALLPDICETLPLVWNEEKGIVNVEVASVVPLTESQQQKLAAKLEAMESAPVALHYRIDPTLIGGISVRRGNIFYDVSLAGALDRLKGKILE